MYIRRVKTRTTANGTCYYSYRLVDSHREAGHVRQRTLLNLGASFSIAEEHWSDLAQRIEQLILGQQSIFPLPENTEQEAQLIVARILKKYQGSELLLSPGKPQPEAHQDEPSKDQDIRGVDINSVQHNSPRSVGGEAIALHALQRAGLSEKLKELGFNQNQLHAAIGNIIGRMIQPGSELSTHTWLQHHTALGDLLDFDYTRQGLSALYRASDLLWQHRDAIESHLYQQHAELFDIKESIVLYDLTNTFFEGTGKYNDLAAFGHSKEKRSDCPLVTLAMVLDSSGFTRHSQILPGNVSEPETLQKMILALYTESKDKDKAVDTPEQTTLDLQHPPSHDRHGCRHCL